MKFTGQFTGLKLDQRAWKAQLRKHLEPKLHECIREWVRAVTGRVPVWSGMARASLLKLSIIVNERIAISPVGGVKSRIPQGRALGTARKSTDGLSVTIITKVPHYTLQEYTKPARGGSPSAPWFSLLAGEVAFKNAIKNVTLPPLIFKPFVKTI